MVTNTSSINSNLELDVGSALTLTDETIVTLYILPTSGDHNNHQMGIQISPDNGVNWIDYGHLVAGESALTEVVSTTQVRAKVYAAEGADSTLTAILVAK